VDFVVGNPPYVRLENIPAYRSAAYRRACSTMRGRSDIFVGFIETGLRLLNKGGVLGYIVADRWMRNQYGSELRRLIAESFSVENVLVMHDVDAFEERVSAYPAVTVIRRAPQKSVVLADATATFGASDAKRFVKWSRSDRSQLASDAVEAERLADWFSGCSSWPAGRPSQLALVADLERKFPPLEDRRTGTRVGIGVASGADEVYLTRQADCVEEDRLLPLLLTRDTADGTARWSGTYLVNPWKDGRLVDLADFPRLSSYLDAHATAVKSRHVARVRPERWYRTIDRVEPGLLERRKLLLPDLKAFIHPVLDDGVAYPHHGLYHVTSDAWDLEVLGGLLLSQVAELFVSTYCVKMRGGCYRFQAQYLRRIRLPDPGSIKKVDRRVLARAFDSRDLEAATAIAARLYGVKDAFISTGRS
jgi:adenine-specific DNA-methyltransferase